MITAIKLVPDHNAPGRTVDEATFRAFVDEFASGEPRAEKQTEYSYECFDDADGNEIAFAAYNSYRETTYTIKARSDG